VPNPDVCDPANYQVLDSVGGVLYSGTIASGGSQNITITNSVITLNNSEGGLISTLSVLAQQNATIVAPDANVEVNGVAFDSVVSNGTIDIDVFKSTGNDPIGSKQGQFWRIGDSVITLNNSAATLISTTNVKATETATIVAPDGAITVNSAAFSSVESNGTENVVVKDTDGTLVGSKVGSEWIVPKGGTSPSGIGFQFPQYAQRTSYRTGDVGDRVLSGWMDDFPYPDNPIETAELDYTSANWWRILKRPLTVNGVSSVNRFVDVNGLMVWGAADNIDFATIDKLSGLMYTRGTPIGALANWDTKIDDGLAASLVINGVTYDDWYLASADEFIHLLGLVLSTTGGIYDGATLLAGTGQNNNWSSTTNTNSTTQAITYSTTTGNTVLTAKTSTRVGLYVRKAFNLISA
jgi:hypothetical protein